MAKSRSLSKTRHDTGKATTGKSSYGSHAELVVDHSSFNLTLDDDKVLCKDQNGYYVTLKNRLDNGLADPNRWSLYRININKE
jgi:hypothetical protein